MKAETINNNLHRLCHFLNMPEDRWRTCTEPNISIEFLLKEYSRILDYHGAPMDGLSHLYLPAEDYIEMENWIVSFPIEFTYHLEAKDEIIDNDGQKIGILRPATMGLMYDGYRWHIQKTEP